MEHTEKVIEEMLENLLQSDDDIENFNETPKNVEYKNSAELNVAEKTRVRNEGGEPSYGDAAENAVEQTELTTTKPNSAHNLTIAEELRKMREEYPMSADSEETLTTPSTIALKTTSIASDDGDDDDTGGGGGDLSAKTSSSKISYDAEQIAYRNEVSRVLFAGKTENCPAENTPEYFAAAQEYAIYGNDFMDFLPDFDQVYTQLKQNETTKTATNNKAAANANVDTTNVIATTFDDSRAGKTPKSRFDFANRSFDVNANVNDVNWNIEHNEQTILNGMNNSNNNNNSNGCINNNNNVNFQGFQPQLRATTLAQQQKPLSAVATAGAATAATYYQLCSNLQRPTNTTATVAPTFNNANTTAVNANVLLNNNVAPHTSNVQYQQPVFQHHQLSAASNLSQAAAAAAYSVASNVRFTPNAAPLLPMGAATATPASSGVNVGAVNVYERMVYAQLLQQQLIKTRQQQLQQQQQQQAIAAATIFQQQLQRQQQLKMATAMQQHVAHVANTNVASSGVDLTANVNMQRTSPNPQVVNFSATLTSSQSRSSNSANKPTSANFNHTSFSTSSSSTRESNNAPNSN